MKTLANIIWIIFAGFMLFVYYLLLGFALCITIIGIPFGVQCFKIAFFSLAPFGKKVTPKFNKHPIANVIWAILFGWESALMAFFGGIILCLTIIGIPLAKKCFDYGFLLLAPFGAKI